MADPITLSAADVDKAVYVAIATAKDDAPTDVLAGILCHVLIEHPNLPAAQIRAAIDEVRNAIAANPPDPESDLSPNSSALMSRLLTRAIPVLTTPNVRTGAARFAGAFLNSYRQGTGQLRQVASIDLQFDRLGEVERFRHDTWQKLYELAKAKPAVAAAIDQSVIAEVLGVRTTQNAAAQLEAVPLQPWRLSSARALERTASWQ